MNDEINDSGGGEESCIPVPDTYPLLQREEILASMVMKELSERFGTRGKSAKEIFLQAFAEDRDGIPPSSANTNTNGSMNGCPGRSRGRKSRKNELPVCEEELSDGAYQSPDQDPCEQGQMMNERPAALVSQSAYIRHLEALIRHELGRTGCVQHQNEDVAGGHGGSGDNSGSQSQPKEKEKEEESEEKTLTRLKIYKRAFGALILHFEALRPILRDIKRSYDQVLALKDRQLFQVQFIKKGIAQTERMLDEKMSQVQFEGFKQLSDMEKQCFLLMRHVDLQDATIRTMTSILSKIENSLSEEHDLRRDSEDQRRLLIVEINEHRKRLGLQPKAFNTGAAVAGYSGPGGHNTPAINSAEFEDFEPEIITSDDPIILRKALDVNRKNLTEAQRRIVNMEIAYADVVPRAEYDELKDHYQTFRTETQVILQKYQDKCGSLMSELSESRLTSDTSAADGVSSGKTPLKSKKSSKKLKKKKSKSKAVSTGKSSSKKNKGKGKKKNKKKKKKRKKKGKKKGKKSKKKRSKKSTKSGKSSTSTSKKKKNKKKKSSKSTIKDGDSTTTKSTTKSKKSKKSLKKKVKKSTKSSVVTSASASNTESRTALTSAYKAGSETDGSSQF